MRKTAGFTLIELIIVIVIIGILAAIAVPRFINQARNARVAALNGLVGGINAASALAQSEYVAEGSSTSTSVAMTGATGGVAVAAGTGIPTLVGIQNALSTLSGFTYNSGTGVFSLTGAPAACNVTYSATTGVATAAASTNC